MAEANLIDSFENESPKTPLKGVVLAILMMVILSGSLYLLSFLFRSFTWLIWGMIYVIIYLFSKELPLRRLMVPVMPYLIWLYCYLVWGLIVSPLTDIPFAAKVAVTTTTLAACMAILTAKPHYLRTFANAAQFAVVANVLALFLMLHSQRFSDFVLASTQRTEAYELGVSRFAGLWGNPNMAGYICLIATILSILATRWIAWIGRLSCLPLLYLTASRKSMIIYFVILFLYLVIVQRRNFKFWVLSAATAASLVLAFALSNGLRAKSQSAQKDPTIIRLMDWQETETVGRGGETRVDLLHHWTTRLSSEPWYGYGLQAMAGTMYDEKNHNKVVSKGVFPMGTHNTYLGILIDIGPLGFIAFILVLIHYGKLCLVSGRDTTSQWVLTSLLVCNTIILFVSHSHLFCFEGKVVFTLLFLLPTAPGLRELGRWKTQTG